MYPPSPFAKVDAWPFWHGFASDDKPRVVYQKWGDMLWRHWAVLESCLMDCDGWGEGLR